MRIARVLGASVVVALLVAAPSCVGSDVAPLVDGGSDGSATDSGTQSQQDSSTAGKDAEAGSDASGPAAGSIDTTFGTGGVTLVTAGDGFDVDYFGKITANFGRAALVMQSDGSIVIAGTSVTAGVAHVELVRLQADGSLDTGFGAGGKTNATAAPGTANAVALQASGDIIVAGSSTQTKGKRMTVWRFSTAGALDPVFGNGGVSFAPDPTVSGNDLGRTAVVRSDGDILVGGAQAASPQLMVSALFDGTSGAQVTTYDNELNSLMSYFTGFCPGSDGCGGYAIGLQAGDKAIMFGADVTGQKGIFSRTDNTGSYNLVQVGTPPSNGLSITGSSTNGITAVAMRPTGAFITASGTIAGTGGISLAAFTVDGNSDTTFGTAGTGALSIPVSTSLDVPWAITAGADGKYVVVGQNGTTNAAFALRALSTGASADSSFGTNGVAASVFGAANDPSVAFGVGVTTSGALIVAGVCKINAASALGELCVTRLLP